MKYGDIKNNENQWFLQWCLDDVKIVKNENN